MSLFLLIHTNHKEKNEIPKLLKFFKSLTTLYYGLLTELT